MTEPLSKPEFDALCQEVANQQAEVAVDRNLARQFYTHVSLHNVRDLTGISVAIDKIVVMGLLTLAVLSILACLGLLIANFQWAAVIIAPIIGIFWTVIAGFTTGHGNLATSIGVLALVLVAALFIPAIYALPMATFASSVFCYRVAHVLAQSFLIKLVLNAYEAFEMLSEHIEIIRNDD